MSDAASTAPVVAGIGLLERSLAYTLGSLQLVTPSAMTRPTPCRGWDLQLLLMHMDDSLLALHEAAGTGRVGLDPAPGEPDPSADLVTMLRTRGCDLLGAWTNGSGDRQVRISGVVLTGGVVSSTGALEIAVTGRTPLARRLVRVHSRHGATTP